MSKYIWIGHRETEIFKTNNLFEYSITTWGSGKNSNISYCEFYNTRTIDISLRNKFLIDNLQKLFKTENYKVIFYSSTLAYSLAKLCPEFAEHFICLNSSHTLSLLNNKINTRLWLSNHLPTLDFILLWGTDCNYKNIRNYFPDKENFIIQESQSSGGLGTFYMNQGNYKQLEQELIGNEMYLVSVYATPSFSVNMHILLTDEEVICFPGSVQIIEKYQNNLIYSGADYISYTFIDELYKEKINLFSKKLGRLLIEIGYRGICGIDYIIYNHDIYFIEINPRFQASTVLLNYALADTGLPSIQELNLRAFTKKELPSHERLENLNVNYSLYRYKKESQDISKQYLNKLCLLESDTETFEILFDGTIDGDYDNGTYLFQAIWKRHITSCGKDGVLHLHPNIPLSYFIEPALPLTHTLNAIIRLKIALINQGIRIQTTANDVIKLSGGYNESVFNSIDLILFNYLRINTPININLSSLSPFSLGYNEKEYVLYYYHELVCNIKLEFSKSIEGLYTKNKIPYKTIAFISGDRLRIKPKKRCFYKEHQIGCQFCPGNTKSTLGDIYNLSDIKEVIDYCVKNEKFRHILIGGGSSDPMIDDDLIIPVIEYIRSKTNKPIYLMSIPPYNIDYVNKYINAGVEEIAFNLELFDRKIASEYMPGKGIISLQDYILKLERAVSLLGKKGNVRSMLMAGLEKNENTLTAVKLLSDKGIQPMISIFRPTPNCKLSYLIQPSNEDMYNLFIEAEKICKQNGLSLGPTCPSCQNNTLSITLRQD